MLHFTTTSIFV